MRGFDSLGRSTRIFVIIVICLGLGIIPVGLLLYPIHASWEYFYLAVGTQVAALMTIRWARGMHSVTTPLLLATGLVSPGAGVCLVAWLAIYDGRRPGKDIAWWAFLFNRANLSLSHGIPSLSLLLLPPDSTWILWSVPLKTLLYTVGVIAINYPLTARVIADITGVSAVKALFDNVGVTTLRSLAILGFVGGLLFVLLAIPSYVGWVMAPGLFGIVVAVRSNYEDSHKNAQERAQTLQLLAQALDARDAYTESHSERVGELASAIADILGLAGTRIEELRTAGQLHDIGKIGVRDAILNKTGPLESEEWAIMKTHPVIGAEMILRHSALAKLAPMVRGHHERWNGTGYPDQLHGAAIPLGSRILAVADSFDTITTARGYRASVMTAHQAVEDITGKAGAWYDLTVVNALRIYHGLDPVGDLAERADIQPFGTPGALKLLGARPRFAQMALGMTVSSLGDPLTTVAVLVSVFAVDHDPRVVAAAFVVRALGTVALATFGASLADMIRRRELILCLEALRAAVLVATPFLLALVNVWLIFPILFVLSAVNAVVQPARQAAIPELVEAREVGAANAALTGAGMIAGAAGYALAGLVLWTVHSTAWLFITDGVTFAVAGLLVIGLGDIGGGVKKAGLLTGLSRTWAVQPARLHLAVAGAGAFFLSMSFPTLITLAYRRAPDSGPTAYTVLEVMLATGIVVGSILVGRMRNIGSMRTVAQGLAATGLFSVAVAISPWLWLVAILILIASAGNPVYSVGNVTALMDASDSSNRGTIMSSRFALTQLALILGTTAGGFISSVVGPEATYGVLGLGLLAVAAVVAILARERRVVGEAAP